MPRRLVTGWRQWHGHRPSSNRGPVGVNGSDRMKVRAIKFKDTRFDNFHTEVNGRWDYDDFISGKHANWFHDWISFDTVLADDARNCVWCGLTSFAGDIFHCYDRATGKFRSLNYSTVGDRYDAKFHQGLFFDRRGAIWAAT